MKSYKEKWKKKIWRALCLISQEENIKKIDIIAEIPPDPDLGDIAFPMFQYARYLRMSPKDIANRVVETRFEGDLNDLIEMTTDHSIRFDDDRLPGGSIRGKVTNYVMSIDGDSGQVAGRVTIISCIGKGTDSSGTGTQ